MGFIELLKSWRERRAWEESYRFQEGELTLKMMKNECEIQKLKLKELGEQIKEQKKRRKLKPSYLS